MNIRTINHHFSVSGPLTKADIYALAEAGVTTLINGRPDFEEPNQIPDAMLRNWARGASLEYYFVPVVSGNYSERDVAEFGDQPDSGQRHGGCIHPWYATRRG